MRPLNIICHFLSTILIVLAFMTPPASADGLCTDDTLDLYMAQPVEETLSNTRVIYASETNFRRLATSEKRPLMVLIYNNDQEFSKGLAAVATCVLSRHPQVRFIAYEIVELSQKELDRAGYYLGGTVQAVPSLYLYSYTKDGMELQGLIREGYREKDLVKEQIERVSDFVKKRLLP